MKLGLYLLVIFTLFSCASFKEKTAKRSPGSIEKRSCINLLDQLLNTRNLVSKNIWQKLLKKESRAIYNVRIYENAYRKLIDLDLAEIKNNYSYFGGDIQFEEVLAYVDVLIRKTQKSNIRYNDLQSIIDKNNRQAKRLLISIKNKFDNDYTLTHLEIRTMMGKYVLLTMGAPVSVLKNAPQALYNIAYRSFINKVITKSLRDLFVHEKFKRPVMLQMVLDKLFRAHQSRASIFLRNIIAPAFQLSAGLVPLPLKEISFFLNDETVELIWKYGFKDAWPIVRERYKSLGYTTLGFNKFAQIYAPIGLLGFFVTQTYFFYISQNDFIDKQAKIAEKLIYEELEAAQEFAEEVTKKAKIPLLEMAIANFIEINKREPNTVEYQDLVDQFGDK